MTVVLTPTISLMNDQCLKLNSNGILATFLGSGQMDKDTDSKVKEGEFKVVYVTPEKFFDDNGAASALFSNMLFGGRIGLVAVDEAHLVRSWQAFRYVPDYKYMKL